MKAGWPIKRLGDLSDLITKGTTPTSVGHAFVSDGVNFIKVESLSENGQFIEDKFAHITQECHAALKRSQLNDGDILFSIAGALGRTALVREDVLPANINQALAIIRLRKSNEVLPEFVLKALETGFLLEQIEKFKGGVAQQNLSLAQVQEFQIPLPPLPEQQRIVGILDEAFDGIATAKANAEQNLQNARALFESHLQSVFTQRGEGWVKTRMDAIYRVGSSKRVLKSEWKSEGVPFYRGREVTRLAADGFVDNELFISEEHFAELSKEYGVPKAGDIVITAIGTIGNLHVVRSSDRFYFKDASVLWMKRTAEVSSEFIKFWFKSSLFFDQLDRGNGATVDTLTIKKLQSVELFLPPTEEQLRIVAQLNALSEETQRLEFLYQRKLAALDELKKSLLHQAFSGAL